MLIVFFFKLFEIEIIVCDVIELVRQLELVSAVLGR
jgi:hypothetical protein